MNPRSRSATLAGLLTFASIGAHAASVVIGGSPGSTNVYPFGAPSIPYAGEYQQVYAASAFPGLFSIGSIGFETGGPFQGTVSLTFTISLSNTSASPTSASTTYANNRGANFTQVFSGSRTLTGLHNGTFDFVIPITPFLYNPALGNLLVDVNILSETGTLVTFVMGTQNLGRVFNFGGSGASTFDANYGLFTEFIGTAAVSEPDELALFGIASVALAAAGLRRRRAA